MIRRPGKVKCVCSSQAGVVGVEWVLVLTGVAVCGVLVTGGEVCV